MSADDVALLVHLRLEQARQALEDARLLLEAGRPPLGIVNRCYYAMFYAVLALLQRVGRTPRKHAELISLFDKEFVKKGAFTKQESKDLHRVFELRQVSDYRAAEPITRKETAEAFAKAERFVRVIGEHLSSGSS